MIIHTIDAVFILLHPYWVLLHWISGCERPVCKPLLWFICPRGWNLAQWSLLV